MIEIKMRVKKDTTDSDQGALESYDFRQEAMFS